MSKKYIIIGQIPTSNPNSYGGATVLTKQMLNYFNENYKEYIFIQANKYEGNLAFVVNYLYVICTLLKNIIKIDIIIVNVTIRGAFYVSPLVLFFARLLKKRFAFRMFAGNFYLFYENARFVRKILIKYVIKNSDILFFETKYEVEYFKKLNPNTHWFPNNRKKPLFVRPLNKKYDKKFIFLGHIRQEKGINEILEASTMLDGTYSIELYGTIIDSKYNESLWKKYPNVKYKGALKPEKVYASLSENDVLILPSYREGYPGVVIEGLGVGLPIIVTNLQGIREMLDRECGILIEPKQAEQLAEAMKSITIDSYKKMSSCALENFNYFEYESIYKRILKVCERL